MVKRLKHSDGHGEKWGTVDGRIHYQDKTFVDMPFYCFMMSGLSSTSSSSKAMLKASSMMAMSRLARSDLWAGDKFVAVRPPRNRGYALSGKNGAIRASCKEKEVSEGEPELAAEVVQMGSLRGKANMVKMSSNDALNLLHQDCELTIDI